MKLKKSLSVIISSALIVSAASVALTQMISAESAAPAASVTLEEFWGSSYSVPATPAEDFEYSFDKEQGGIVITDYKGYDSTVKVPDTIDGSAVVAVDFGKSNKIISELILPDTLKDIELKRYDDIISYLKNLKAPTTGYSYTYDAENKGIILTNYAGSETWLRLPDTLDIMVDGVKTTTSVIGVDFTACEKDLDLIMIPEKVEAPTLGKYADVALKLSLVNSVALDNDLANIGVAKLNVPAACLDNRSALAGTTVRSAYIPAEVDKIPEWTFGGCEWLYEVVIAGDNIEVGNYAFSNCAELTDLDASVLTKVGDWAFGGCENFENINLSDKLTYIGDGAFSRCEEIVTANVGPNVTYIGEYAFDGCENLMAINVNEGNGSYTSVDGVLFNKKMTVIMKMPENSMITDYVIPNGVKEIDTAAFRNSNIKSVTIPSGVNYIGYNAFVDSKLTYIGLPRSVSVVEEGAFGKATVGTNRYTSGSGNNIYNGINTSFF